MPRNVAVSALIWLTAFTASCNRTSHHPVVVRVLRDPYFSADLIEANIEFARMEPHLRNGASIVLESKDDIPYMDLSKRLQTFRPQVFVLFSQHFVPEDSSIRNMLGASETVCGTHVAFVPNSVTGDEREAAELYLRFLASRCPSVAVQQSPVAESQQGEPDPHRPPCLTAHCRKIEKFIKDHYCGESPFGNGPANGCDYKEPVRSGAKLVVSFHCEWDESAAKSTCQQLGQPSPHQREVLLRELRRVGLPTNGEDEIAYTVVESPSGWVLLSANYSHLERSDSEVCEVVIAIEQSGQVHVLRSVKLHKTNNDVPEGTSWSPLDIADVDGDGEPEMVLRGDAYEDHWLEVIQMQGDSVKTVFSGLGYYL